MCRTEAISASSSSPAMALEEEEQPPRSDSSSSSSGNIGFTLSANDNDRESSSVQTSPSKENACTPPIVKEQTQDLLTTQRRPSIRSDTLGRGGRRRTTVMAVAGVVLVVVVGLRLGCVKDRMLVTGLLKARPDMRPAVSSFHEVSWIFQVFKGRECSSCERY